MTTELLVACLWFLVGAGVAGLHAQFVLAGVRGALKQRAAARLLVGAPLRILLPAGVLFAAGVSSLLALCAALAGFFVGGLVARWRLAGLGDGGTHGP